MVAVLLFSYDQSIISGVAIAEVRLVSIEVLLLVLAGFGCMVPLVLVAWPMVPGCHLPLLLSC